MVSLEMAFELLEIILLLKPMWCKIASRSMQIMLMVFSPFRVAHLAKRALAPLPTFQ